MAASFVFWMLRFMEDRYLVYRCAERLSLGCDMHARTYHRLSVSAYCIGRQNKSFCAAVNPNKGLSTALKVTREELLSSRAPPREL